MKTSSLSLCSAAGAALFLTVAGCGAAASNPPAPTPDAGAPRDAAPVADAPPAPRGLPALGGGTHDINAVRVEVVATEADDLATPRDLAFNPQAPEQLWVVNFGSNTATVIRNPGTPERDSMNRRSVGYDHFLVRPAALAFGAPGIFSSAQEMDEITQRTTPADFMGPVLWDADYDRWDGGDGSHIDMLHNSPNAVGIAWEADNVYWVVDGAHRSLTRYDFQTPHERGGVDHRTANVRRYAQGMITYTEGVSNHAEFVDGVLYVCDPGSNRVLRFDPGGAEMGTRILPNYDGSRQTMMNGGAVETFVDGAMNELRKPSGLAFANDHFYVVDNETSRVTAFNREGRRVDWVDLSSQAPAGSLQGVALDGQGRLYIADAVGNRVLQVAPRNAR